MDRKSVFLTVLISAITAASAADTYSQWSYYKNISFDSRTAGVTANVAKIPILIRLKSTNFDFSQTADSNGRDIRFSRASSAAIHLPYQIERWSKGQQVAEIWVLPDTVYGNDTGLTARSIRMYWGKSAAGDSSNPRAVFDSANGFHSVWHLGVEPSGISASTARPNAVAGGNVATPANLTIANAGRTGVIGWADTLNGTNQYFDIGSGYKTFTTGFTYSVWMYPTNIAGQPNESFFEVFNAPGSNLPQDNIKFNQSLTSTDINWLQAGGPTGTILQGASASGALIPNEWHQYSVTFANLTATLYKDGNKIGGGSFIYNIKDTLRSNGYLGRPAFSTDAYFCGKFDEGELSKVARSPDWIRLSYKNQQPRADSLVKFRPALLNPPSVLTYSHNGAYYKDSLIPPNVPKYNGVVTRFSLSAPLPPGLTMDTVTGIITGRPTTTGSYAETITAHNSVGMTSLSLPFTITVMQPPTSLYYNTPVIYTINAPINPNVPTLGGGTINVTYSVSPALPKGLGIHASSGIISGTPTVAVAASNYIVTAANFGGSITATVNITVNNAPPTNLMYVTPVTYTLNAAINPNTPTVTGTVASYSVSPPLPAGLTLNTSTGVISGTPTALVAAANYTVTASNGGGSTTAIVNITVNNAPPTNLAYTTPVTYTLGTDINPNTPTVTGTVTSYSVSPALPAGLSLSATTGVISGAPTALAAAANYIITATNGSGSTIATVNITVNNAAPSNLTYATPVTYTLGTAITANTPTVTGTVASYSVSPALPAGLSLNISTGVISGVPSALATATNYVVTATNIGGFTTATVNITVNNAAPSGLLYTTPVTYTLGSAITANTPTVTGTVASYSVGPTLPTGLSLNTSTGVISGVPSALAGAANYTVTATNGGGSTTAIVNITVNNAAPSNLLYTTPVTYTLGTTITPNVPTVTGTVTSYSVSPTLPAGLSLNTSTGVISGVTTTFTAAANYTVTATNGGGSTTAIVNITVNSLPPGGLSYSQNPATFTVGKTIMNDSPTVTGTVTHYSVSPSLPPGLSINSLTGIISGVPTLSSEGGNYYTITASNSQGSTTNVLIISVIVPTLSWNEISTTPVAMQSVYFTNANTGYAVGSGGTISKTTDAGVTWNPQTADRRNTLYGVHFTDANTGFAVGKGGGVQGSVYRTINGGVTWTPAWGNDNSAHWLYSIHFPNHDVGYSVGYGGAIIKSQDGGLSWSLQTSGTSKYLTSVFFNNDSTGFAVGEGGTILQTKNGGTVWTLKTGAKVKSLFSIHFPSADIGYAVGTGGTILKTSDSGNTWTALNSGIHSTLYSVRFTDVKTGYAAGGYGVILKTVNGGLTWLPQTSGSKRDLYSICFPTVDTAYSAGFETGSGTGGILRAPTLIRNTTAKRGLRDLEIGRDGEIGFDLLHKARIKISVTDFRGRLMANVSEGIRNSGRNFVDISKVILPQGTYVLDIQVEDKHLSMMFTR